MPLSNQATIFIADDDPEDLKFLMEAIQNHKSPVIIRSFTGGRDILNILLRDPTVILPDLIILDYNMPPVTGLDVLSAVKDNHDLRNIPKLIWSTSNKADYVKACFESGASAYFIKPYSLQEYDELVKKIFTFLHLRETFK